MLERLSCPQGILDGLEQYGLPAKVVRRLREGAGRL
jgi:hypothetical protein